MDVTDAGDIHLTNPSIKTEEIEIKSEPIDDETFVDIPCYIKEEEWDTSLQSQNGLEDTEETKSVYIPDSLKGTNAESTFTNYESSECLYRAASEVQVNRSKSTGKGLLKPHQLKHKKLSQVHIYECDDCDYKSTLKASLKSHQLKHKNPAELQAYRCDSCDYKSIYKSALRNHMLRHKDPSEVQIYKCEECEFITKRRENLKPHRLRHRDPSELIMYTCDQCDYKSIEKGCYKRHLLKHKHLSEVQMFRCDKCKFVTKYRASLARHRSTHKDPSESPGASVVQMYEECDVCD